MSSGCWTSHKQHVPKGNGGGGEGGVQRVFSVSYARKGYIESIIGFVFFVRIDEWINIPLPSTGIK